MGAVLCIVGWMVNRISGLCPQGAISMALLKLWSQKIPPDIATCLLAGEGGRIASVKNHWNGRREKK